MERRSFHAGGTACAKALWQVGAWWEGGNNEVQTSYLSYHKPGLSQCSSWQLMLGSRGVGLSKPSCPWSFMYSDFVFANSDTPDTCTRLRI